MHGNVDEDWRVDGVRCRNPECPRCHPENFHFPIAWTVGLLDLPPELQMQIFLTLFNQQSVVALRLTCRKLEGVYQHISNTIRADQRERIVAPVRNFLEFLDRFKLPNGRVRHPPPGGWPHVQPSPDNGLRLKTPFVVDILRHLSYIHNPEPQFQFYYDGCITYRSTMVDYSETDWYQAGEEDMWLEYYTEEDEQPGPSESRHILTLAEGWEGPGYYIYIDTWTGLVYEEELEGGPQDEIALARDFFSKRIKSLKRFEQVFVPGENVIFRRRLHRQQDESSPSIYDLSSEDGVIKYGPDGDPYDAEAMERQGVYDGEGRDFGWAEDADWIRHLYFKHGWPGENWDKNACLQASEEFVERRNS